MREVGNVQHCVSSIVLDPQQDRHHYHLVYATRSLKGLMAFRQVEEKALVAQREMRARVRAERRMARSDQLKLYDGDVLDTRYMDELIERYQKQAQEQVTDLLQQRTSVPYDDVVARGLSFPTISNNIVKQWLKEWKRKGLVEFQGLKPGARVPKVNSQHAVRWLE